MSKASDASKIAGAQRHQSSNITPLHCKFRRAFVAKISFHVAYCSFTALASRNGFRHAQVFVAFTGKYRTCFITSPEQPTKKLAIRALTVPSLKPLFVEYPPDTVQTSLPRASITAFSTSAIHLRLHRNTPALFFNICGSDFGVPVDAAPFSSSPGRLSPRIFPRIALQNGSRQLIHIVHI